jgi:hypothetical protein
VIAVLDELKSSNKLKNYSSTLLKLLEFPKPWNKAQIKKMLIISDPHIFADYLVLRNTILSDDISDLQKLLNEIIQNKEPYLISHLNINGEELLKLGINGKKIGKTLAFLRDMIIENPDFNTKEKLIEYAANI